MRLVWLIPLLPAGGAALNGLFGIRWFGRTLAAAVGCASIAGALVVSLLAFGDLAALPPDARLFEVVLGNWIPAIPLATAGEIGMFTAKWALTLDPLSALMVVVVTAVGLLIHIYAAAYMHDEPRGGFARFFCYLNLFCAFMLVLVLASNFLVLFLGWEGVGLCSYLLIGFWYEKDSAASAAKKAFLVNRIGDWGFLLGIFLVFFTFGTLDFREVAAAASSRPVETAGFGALSAICLLLFAGAAGKSAQLPLHVWLPDAMEGPTPVSALIHAATMVTAGVYVVARNATLFEHAPLVMQIIAAGGAATALMAATIASVQTDIKRVLAYSTVSQLGLMFLASGVGAFAAAVFHLTTHACFKALLFLGSGSVVHAVAGERDMHRMGGLRKSMPVTFITMLVGSLSIAGIPPMAGFFSKDEILAVAFSSNPVLWVAALATSLLTAFYMFRLMALTFYGPYRGSASPGVHRTPRSITVPLILLAAGAAMAGLLGIPQALGGTNVIARFLEPDGHALEGGSVALGGAAQLGLMSVSIIVAIAGISVARYFYSRNTSLPGRLARRWRAVHSLLMNGYYVDALYDATIVRGTLGGARRLTWFDRHAVDGAVNGAGWLGQIGAWIAHMIDKYVVDGLVNLAAWSASRASFAVRRGQTGLLQNYALLMLAGLFAFLTVFLFGRG